VFLIGKNVLYMSKKEGGGGVTQRERALEGTAKTLWTRDVNRSGLFRGEKGGLGGEMLRRRRYCGSRKILVRGGRGRGGEQLRFCTSGQRGGSVSKPRGKGGNLWPSYKGNSFNQRMEGETRTPLSRARGKRKLFRKGSHFAKIKKKKISSSIKRSGVLLRHSGRRQPHRQISLRNSNLSGKKCRVSAPPKRSCPLSWVRSFLRPRHSKPTNEVKKREV